MTPKLSQAQRAVLAKMADGWVMSLGLWFKRNPVLIEKGDAIEVVNIRTWDSLKRLGFIADRPLRFGLIRFKITPAGRSALASTRPAGGAAAGSEAHHG